MLRSDVYKQLKDRLFSGDLKTGQFVSQRELTSLLGATLNPVREALRKLEAEGLINVYPQRGIQIIEGGPKDINDAYDYRILLEISAIAIFSEEAEDSEIQALMDKVGATLQSIDNAPRDKNVRLAALEDDYTFHKHLVDFQRNKIISKYYSLNAARLRLFRVNLGEPLARLDIAAREHLEILKAVLARDHTEAAALLKRHIEISREHTLGIRPMRDS